MKDIIMEIPNLLPQKPFRNYKTFKVFSIGLVLGLVVTVSAVAYLYMKQPKNACQLSEAQIWAGKHEKETVWAKERLGRLQQAANEAYFKSDGGEVVISSK